MSDEVRSAPTPVDIYVWHEAGMRVLDEVERTGDPELAAQAVLLLQRAVHSAAPDNPHLAAYTSNLGAAHSQYFELTGDPVALEAAMSAYRQARDLTPREHENYPAYCSNLGVVLTQRFELSGQDADLDAAITAQATAVAATPDGHPDRPLYLSNLGSSYTTRFERTGELGSLDLAVEALQAAVAATGPTDPDRAGRLTNLGRARLRRFEQTADTDTLFAAIAALGAAVGATGPDHPDHPPRAANLGGAFLRLFDHSGDIAALDLAVEALEEATGVPHRLRASHLTNLGTAYQRRFGRTRDPASADAAVQTYQEAVRITAPDDPGRPGVLSNLGNACLRRYRATRRAEDLDLALASLDEAVRTAPAGHPEQTSFLTNRGDAHATRFGEGGDPAALEAALRDYGAAAQVPVAPALSRARAALEQGRLAASADPGRPEALDGFAHAIGLIEQVVWLGLSRADRERLLREFADAASDATACALAQGRPEYAVEVSERGRGVLLSQALDTRTSYDTLHEQHPELADRLLRIQRALDRPELTTSLSEPGPVAATEVGERFLTLARERDELVTAIRALPGYRDFLRPAEFDALRSAADEGPVVIVNVSRYRCDAVVVRPGGVEVIELPGLPAAQVSRVADRFLTLVRRARMFRELPPGQRRQIADALREILAWLWRAIAEPVLDRLGFQRRDRDWPRLWWCPTGLSGLLPLHCAQQYDHERLADDGVLDRVASSYTPTLRALITGRTGLPAADSAADPASDADHGLLAVVMAQTPGLPPLRGTGDEIDAVGETLAPDRTLRTGDATRHAVASALREHPWLHYIGHSAQDPSDPGRAALFLHDGALTMREIAGLHLDHAEFAYLSSCESALGATTLPDEALHLAGALGMAGFRHVIATMWSIRDDTAARIAGELYRRLTPGGGFDPAQAAVMLHRTLREIRATHPLLVWAAYSHTGP
jgi:tetratricopeptide (TPR) repeat protein